VNDIRKRILVVDDQEENVYLLRVLLASQDYDVLEARDGRQALEILEREACDLVLLDVMMPGIDGYQVCKRIRAGEKTSQIPVILLTAKRDVDSKVRGLDIGANDYVTKPFERKEILARIRSLLTIDELKKRLVEAEQMAAIGKMIVTLNHEINNPLAAVMGNAELLALTLKDASGDVRKKLQVIQEQAGRVKEILSKVGELKRLTPKKYILDTEMIDLQASQEPDEESETEHPPRQDKVL